MVSFILPGNSATGGYEVDNSLRFNSASSDYLSRTPSSTGNRRTFTISCWVKRSTLTASGKNIMVAWDGSKSSASFGSAIYFNSSDQIEVDHDIAGADYTFNTNMVFRDVSAWYHIVLAVDTTQATESNRQKIYVNGSQVDLTESALGFPTQNFDTYFNTSSGENNIGSNYFTAGYADQYMAEFVLIDGQALDATSFGEFDSDSPNIWKPIDVSGLTFGTNGFYLDFENSGSLGADVSGNGNNFTANNLTSIDQPTDTCTNNFCTLMSNDPSASNFTLSDGNLVVSKSGSGTFGLYGSSIMLTKGKWYYESKITDLGSSDRSRMGVAAYESVTSTSTIQGSFSGFEFTGDTGGRFSITVNGSTTEIDGFHSYAQGDIIMWAIDMDNSKLYIGKNGDWFNYNSANTGGDPTSGNGFVTNNTTALAAPLTVGYVGHAAGVSDSTEVKINFGNPPFTISSGNSDAEGFGNFEYAVPSGYFAICTKNLAEYG